MNRWTYADSHGEWRFVMSESQPLLTLQTGGDAVYEVIRGGGPVGPTSRTSLLTVEQFNQLFAEAEDLPAEWSHR